MQRRAEYCASSKAEETGAEDHLFISRTRGKAARIARPSRSEIFIIRRSIRFARGDLVNDKSRWNPDCALAAGLKSRFSDSTCLPEESFPDGPAALPRSHYRARRMGIDSDNGGGERGAA